jgi:hypothetical protein
MSNNNDDKEFEKRRILALEREKEGKNKADTDKDAASKRMGGTGSLTLPNNIRSTFNDIINDILNRLINKIITDKDIYFNINDIVCTLTNVNLTYVNWKLVCENTGFILINIFLDVPINERYIEIDITNFNNNKLFVNYFEIDIETIKNIELKADSPISEITSKMDNKPGTNKSILEIPINNFTDIMNITMDYDDTIPSYKEVNLSIKKPKYVDIGKFYGYNNLYMPPKKELQEQENKIFLRYILSNIKYFNKISYTKNTVLGLIDVSTLINKSTQLVKEEIKQELVLPESLIQENFGNLDSLTDFYDFEKFEKNGSKKNIEIMFFAIILIIIFLLVLYIKIS